MISLDIHVSSMNPQQFHSQGIAPNGTDWSLVGAYAVAEDGNVQYNFNITYASRFSPQIFSGRLDESGTTLTGSWGFSDTPFSFMFKRLSSEAMRFYPTPTELVENKPRALWRFAISVVRSQLRQSMCSWSHLRERWQTGQRYAELTIRSDISQLAPPEVAKLARYRRVMTPAEARLYRIFRDLRERSIPIHWHVAVFSIIGVLKLIIVFIQGRILQRMWRLDQRLSCCMPLLRDKNHGRPVRQGTMSDVGSRARCLRRSRLPTHPLS